MSAISKIPQNRPSRIAGPSKLPGRILRPTFTNRPQSFFASSVSSAKQHEKREINNFSSQKSTQQEIIDPNRNFRQKSLKSNGLEAISSPGFDENIDTKSKPRPAFVDCNGNKKNYKNALVNIGLANGDESSWLNTKVEIESSISSTECQTNSISVYQDSSTGIAESESDCLSFRSIQPGYFLQKVSAIKNSHQKANAEKLNLVSMPESQNQKPAPDTNSKKQIKSLPLPSKMSGQDFAGKCRFGYKTETPVLSAEVAKSAPPIHSNAPRKPRSRMPKSASNTNNIEITLEEKNTYASRAEKRKRHINAKNAQRRLEENKKTSVTEHDLNGDLQENSNILSESENTAANAPSRRPYFGNQRKNYPRIAKPVARPKKLDSPASDGMPSTLKFDEVASREREEFNSGTDFKNKQKSVGHRKVESRKTSENRTTAVRSRAPLNSDSDANHSDIQSVTNEESEYISSYLSIDEGVNVNSTSAMSQYSRHESETNDINAELSPWQAGNYTTEQKIGTERRLIRSSVSSNGLDQATCLTETKVFFSTPEMEPSTTHETNEGTKEKISYSDSAYERTSFDEEQSENSVEKNGALRSFRFSATSEMTVFSAGSQSPEPNATVGVSLPGSASSVNNSTSKAKKRKTDSLLMSPLPSETKNKQTDSPCSQHNEYSVDQHHDTVIRSSSLEREICFEDDPEDDRQPEDEENLSALNDLSSLQESALISDFPSLLDEEDSINSTGNENEVNLQTKYAYDVKDTNVVSERLVILSSGMQNSSTVQTHVINKLLGKGLNGTVKSGEDILPSTHNMEPLKPCKISECPCENHQPYKSVSSDTSDNRLISIEELRQEQKVFRMSLEKLYHILQEEQAEKTMYTGENEKLRQENNTLKNVVEELTQKLNDINLANKSPQVKEASVQTATPTKWYPPELRDKVQSAIKVASEEIKFLKALHNDFDRRTDGADETLQNALKLFQPEESTDN